MIKKKKERAKSRKKGPRKTVEDSERFVTELIKVQQLFFYFLYSLVMNFDKNSIKCVT